MLNVISDSDDTADEVSALVVAVLATAFPAFAAPFAIAIGLIEMLGAFCVSLDISVGKLSSKIGSSSMNTSSTGGRPVASISSSGSKNWSGSLSKTSSGLPLKLSNGIPL